MAYHMQDSYQREVVRTADHMVFDTAMAAFTETENASKSRTMSIASSDIDSFVSATDVSYLFYIPVIGELYRICLLQGNPLISSNLYVPRFSDQKQSALCLPSSVSVCFINTCCFQVFSTVVYVFSCHQLFGGIHDNAGL